MLQCYNQGTEVNNTVGTVEKEISPTSKVSDKGGSADLTSPKIQLRTVPCTNHPIPLAER